MTVTPARLPLFAAAIVVTVCLGFAAWTGHTWEDFFITFRSSLNLATGHGLVYQPGERVHTFTSPLGTLLPALFALGGGDDVVARALWCFRLASAAALGGALWLAARSFLRAGLAALAAVTACALWALDPKTIDFAVNGMESAFFVLFIVVTWCALADGAAPWRVALGFAGLQWTRPDGVIFFAALVAAWWCFGVRTDNCNARSRLMTIARGIALGFALYLPWIFFAWSYYGSPVPHTILAKASHYPAGEFALSVVLYPWRLLFGHTTLHEVFMPSYFYLGGWPAGLSWISRLFAVSAALAWLWPAVRAPGRIASGAFFLGGLYIQPIPGSPWYYPGWQALAFIAWAFLLDAVWRTAPRAQRAARVLAITLVALQAALLLAVAWQMRAQQTWIEDRQRTVIGRWLRAHAAPGERVYLEPLGYIGFFSGLKMLDYPGLASPEVVAARRAGAKPHAQLIAALQPDWLVLRPDQVAGVNAEMPRLLVDDYRLARVFDVRAGVDSVTFLPGRGYLEFDAVYSVFARAPRPEAAKP
jgi:hypothetical protein